MTKVALIFGGQSTEHDVSIVSARYVNRELRAAGFQVQLIGIDRSGVWHRGDHIPEELSKMGEATKRGADSDGLRILAGLDADVVFPLVHGVTGEDGCLQGYCRLLSMPYVGGDVLNQALCFDKISTRVTLLQHDIPQLPYLSFHHGSYDEAAAVAQVLARFPLPVFVKPSRTGSSVGISRVGEAADLAKALTTAFQFDYRVLVEPGLTAMEVEVAALGAHDPQLSVSAQIVTDSGFYDFKEKYLNNRTRFIIPAPLSESQLEEMHRIAKKAWPALNCYGMARIDFLITPERVYLNEINTCPGFTDISMYPRLFRESGLAGPKLMSRLITLALEREDRLGQCRSFDPRSRLFTS